MWELTHQLLTGSFPWQQWVAAREILCSLLDAQEPVLIGGCIGVPLPQDIVDILSWHVETQLDPRQLKNKEHLLFPGAKGADFRSMSSLAKPFARVAKEIGVKFKFTQRGMRRTYNDLSRAANVKPEIIRSISGHHTEQMREW